MTIKAKSHQAPIISRVARVVYGTSPPVGKKEKQEFSFGRRKPRSSLLMHFSGELGPKVNRVKQFTRARCFSKLSRTWSHTFYAMKSTEGSPHCQPSLLYLISFAIVPLIAIHLPVPSSNGNRLQDHRTKLAKVNSYNVLSLEILSTNLN